MQRSSRTRFLVTFFLYFFIHSVKALTIYFSPTGNDNALGTSPAQAYQTIAKLNSLNLAPGTVVLFEGGKNFSGSIYLDANDANNSAQPVIIGTYGIGKATIQSGNTMGFYAYNTKGFEVRDLTFEGSGMLANSTDGIKIATDLPGNVKLNNIKVTNVEIRNYGKVGLLFYGGNLNTGFKDVVVDQVHIHDVRENGLFVKGHTSPTHVGWSHENFTIKNTEVNDIPGYADPNGHRGSGIVIAQIHTGVIENCVAHHTGSANTHCGGPGGIWAYDCNNITIQRCESYLNSAGSGCDGLGFDFDGGMVNSVLQYNYSHDNDGAGYLLGQYDGARLWSNNTVRYNISENDGRTNSGGITLFKAPNSTMDGCKIYNNTIHISALAANTNAGALTFTDWQTGITGIEVYNNIFQTNGGAFLLDIPTGYDATFAGNLYWAVNGAFKIRYHGPTYNSLSTWRTASGKEQVGSTITGIVSDPLMNNAGTSQIVWPSPTSALNAYRTASNSPAINSALDITNLFAINTGTMDFFNSSLPVTNQRDIGAYERSASSTATEMPTPTVVASANLSLTQVGDPTITKTTGIAEQNVLRETILFYPNPISRGEYLNFTETEAPYHIELFTINGTMALKQTTEEPKFYVSDGAVLPGIYIIKIIDGKDRVLSGKIIVR